MIRTLLRTDDRNGHISLTESVDLADLPRLLADPSNLIWVDIRAGVPETEGEWAGKDDTDRIQDLLRNTFKFHPLAVDDAVIESHVPKVDDWGGYLYIVLHAVVFDPNIEDIDTSELDIFLGRNYLVTHHDEPIEALERQWRNVLRDERHTRRGADYLLYELSDNIAADYLPCMDAMDDVIDHIEDSVFERPEPRVVSKIFKLKTAVLNLRRVLSPQREVLNKLARDDYAVIDPKDRVYFRDIYDHFVRLADLNESLRDMVSGSLDTYLSVAANRTNDIVKTLTLVTVLFMPLSFLTGFFGMNFFGGLIEVHAGAPWSHWLFFGLVVISMVALPVILFWYIRKRGWW